MSHYSNLALLYPQSYKSNHRTFCYITWMVKIADSQPWKMPATIDDPAILDEITTALRTLGLARG